MRACVRAISTSSRSIISCRPAPVLISWRSCGSQPAAPPVVYVTAAGETAVAVAALKAGAADYVAKTVGDEFLELLSSAIGQAIEKARLAA